MPALPPPDFSLEYRPDEDILIGRWLGQASLADIKAAYEALLAAAQAHGNCRRWLLDVRRRAVGDPQGTVWFADEYVPRLAAALNGPLAIAYFAMIDHDTATGVSGILLTVERGQQAHHQFRYFNQEGAALSWLAGRYEGA